MLCSSSYSMLLGFRVFILVTSMKHPHEISDCLHPFLSHEKEIESQLTTCFSWHDIEPVFLQVCLMSRDFPCLWFQLKKHRLSKIDNQSIRSMNIQLIKVMSWRIKRNMNEDDDDMRQNLNTSEKRVKQGLGLWCQKWHYMEHLRRNGTKGIDCLLRSSWQ